MTQKLSLSSQKYRFGIRNPKTTYFGSATLENSSFNIKYKFIFRLIFWRGNQRLVGYMNRFGTSAPYSQVLVSHSVSNPDLWIWIRIQAICWIRIRIQVVVESRFSPDPDKFFMTKYVVNLLLEIFWIKIRHIRYVFFNLYKHYSCSLDMKFSIFPFFDNKLSLPRSPIRWPNWIRIQSGSERLVTGTYHIQRASLWKLSCRLLSAIQMYLRI